MRAESYLDDPWAIELYEAISYDWDKFGKPSRAHALRALAFDRAIEHYLKARPGSAVVALGEGLQTSYWRLGRPETSWLSVDLPAVIELRERLLPNEPKVTSLPASALDRSWMDEVSADAGVMITAEGLFMYLEPDDVSALITDIGDRFPGAQLIYDSIPRWFRDKTLKGLALSDRYTAPPMPTSQTVSEAERLVGQIDSVRQVEDIDLSAGMGL